MKCIKGEVNGDCTYMWEGVLFHTLPPVTLIMITVINYLLLSSYLFSETVPYPLHIFYHHLTLKKAL